MDGIGTELSSPGFSGDWPRLARATGRMRPVFWLGKRDGQRLRRAKRPSPPSGLANPGLLSPFAAAADASGTGGVAGLSGERSVDFALGGLGRGDARLGRAGRDLGRADRLGLAEALELLMAVLAKLAGRHVAPCKL